MTDLTALLQAGIPLSAAAGIEVVEGGPDPVRIRAPFDPNRNYHGTVFGGSQAVAAILAGWLAVDSRLRTEGMAGMVVIQSASIEFVSPCIATFDAFTHGVGPAGWAKLAAAVERRGKGRVPVDVEIVSQGAVVARHRGMYAVVP